MHAKSMYRNLAPPPPGLGTRLGITEVVVAVALLLQRFELRFDRAEEGLRYKYDLTLNLDGTSFCTARPRSRATEPGS